MKSNLIIILSIFLLIFISSCIESKPPEPPVVEITPDSIQKISPIDNVTYNIIASSDEDLIKFSFESNPVLFTEDTLFEDFTHNISFNQEFILPSVINGLPDDSIITVTFTIRDSENSTVVERKLKVVKGYTDINTLNVNLSFPPPDGELFYSFTDNSSYTYDDMIDSIIDLVFIYDSDIRYTLCSPDSRWIMIKLTNTGFPNYPYDKMKHTKIKSITGNWDLMDEKFIYKLSLTEEYINGSPSNGVGVGILHENDILAFELTDGRKGILKISQLSKTQNIISLTIRIQKKS